MAKKKSVNEDVTVIESNILDNIIEKYGNIVKSGTSIANYKPVVVPVSPAIDIGLGGGVPEGSFVILTGEEKAGKTLLALWLAANAQKHYDPISYPNGRKVFFLGIEGRLKPRDLHGIPHLQLDKFHQIVSEKGNILTAEKYLDTADMLIRSEPGCVLIIDSFSQLCTQAEMLAGMDEMQRADGPKLLAKFCRKVANVIPINQTIVIGITHLMSNVTGYGAKYQEKSGNALKYQADVKLRVKKYELLRATDDGVPYGQQVEWKVEFSAIGPPGADVTSFIRYGVGIDESKELVTLGVDLGIIDKAASWFSFANKDEYGDNKYQGLDNLTEVVNTDSNLKEKLRKEIYSTCGLVQ